MNGTIASLTFANLTRGWRALLLSLLPLLFLCIAVLLSLYESARRPAIEGLLNDLNLTTIVPLIALIVGTGSLATEIDDGSIIYLLTKPLNRHRIIATKLAVAIGVSVALTAIPTFIAGVLLSGTVGAVAIAYTLVVTINCIVYSALFIMLSALTRHAVIIGLVYLLLWEGLITGLIDGARVLSVQHWGTSVGGALFPDAISSPVNGTLAAVLAVVVFTAATWYAGSRLRSLTLTSES